MIAALAFIGHITVALVGIVLLARYCRDRALYPVSRRMREPGDPASFVLAARFLEACVNEEPNDANAMLRCKERALDEVVARCFRLQLSDVEGVNNLDGA